jgi:hypothetical protein
LQPLVEKGESQPQKVHQNKKPGLSTGLFILMYLLPAFIFGGWM